MSHQITRIINHCRRVPDLHNALLRSQIAISTNTVSQACLLIAAATAGDADNAIWPNIYHLLDAALVTEPALVWLEIWDKQPRTCPLYKARFDTLRKSSPITAPSTQARKVIMLQDLDNELFHWAKAEHYRGCMICPSHFEDMWWPNFVDWWGDCMDMNDEPFPTVEGAITAAKARIDAEIATFIKEGVWSAISDLHELGVIHIPEA